MIKLAVACLIAVIFLFGCSFAQLEENLDEAKQALVKSQAIVAELSTELDRAKAAGTIGEEALAALAGKLDAAEALTAGAMATVDGMQKILDQAKDDQKDDWIGWAAGILAIVLPVAGRRTRRA